MSNLLDLTIPTKSAKKFILPVLILSIIGMLDASYLTYEHFSGEIPPCSTSIFVDCGKVLRSQYAVFAGLPLSMWGLMFYSTILGLQVLRISTEKKSNTIKDLLWNMLEKYSRGSVLNIQHLLFRIQGVLTSFGAVFSLYLVGLQLFIIQSIRLYCMLSAGVSLSIFVLTAIEFHQKR